MGIYIYTAAKSTKTLITGEVVVKTSYAYKDSWNYSWNDSPKHILRRIDRMETRGFNNARLHNEAGHKLFAQGGKWEVGMPVYSAASIPGKYADDPQNAKFMGYLARDKKDWFISNDNRSKGVA